MMSGAGSKRMAGEAGPSGPPEKKAAVEDSGTTVETIKLGGVSSTEEQDLRTLQVKNKKLAGMLDQRQAIEDELRDHIETLEKRQATDDASLLIINRYWIQFDENIRILLGRYDLDQDLGEFLSERKALVIPEPEPDSDSNSERKDSERGDGPSESSFSFLGTLASSSSEEIESQLQERVESSRRAVARIVLVYDRLHVRLDQVSAKLSSNDPSQMEEAVKELNSMLSNENIRLQEVCKRLQEKQQNMSQEFSQLQTRLENAESRVSVLDSLIEDLQWDIDKVRKREQRLNRHLSEVLERVNSKGYKVYGAGSSLYGGTITINSKKFEEMTSEVDMNKELAVNRLQELDKLRQDLQDVTSENQELQSLLANAVEENVRLSPEYRCMQSQFSVLYNESLQLKAQLDEARSLLHGTRGNHQRQLELIERDEVALQKKVRTEVIQLEDTLAQVRKEYEMLRIEFEQTLAANEQAGPINREMRHLISSLQNHNHQLKGEVLRYKRRLREIQGDINKMRSRSSSGLFMLPSQSSVEEPKEEPVEIKTEPEEIAPPTPASSQPEPIVKREEEEVQAPSQQRDRRDREKERERGREKDRGDTSKEKSKHEPDTKRKEAESVKQMKADLKRVQESLRDMKLLLDMYRSAPKEQRDKVQLMAAERKSKAELEELRQRHRELEERERRDSKKMADEDALRRMRAAEEQTEALQKRLSMAKQEEEALLSEMDVTGQAFEDMQEQNIRLMQQLREKDDANFKLMSERIKSNQIHKLLREEKEELADQLLTLRTQLQVLRKLEEKEHLLQSSIGTGEKELTLRTQALDLSKRKAVESSQQAEELRVQLELSQKKLQDLRVEIIENSASREKDAFNYKRAQEDLSRLRKKLESTKKPDLVPTCDKILMEEIKEFKSRLTCPCCNSRKMDAVLTKCFHVFCFECVKTRYDTRQRKCPKCNAAFGANDFHRIYIG
ncbi:hypothetical protein GDO81_027048 [Engystomops pustulosus]|uniref:E3 ubiquitin protein ligase n=1 Tax=Engystomops pustulosus TaxID=76066 RepID=A0AAV6Z8L1_ENGPU|nr:hypothetical protein GDO81_027048 [Engystomops pustulosus]